ncbi:glycosyltransferase [Enterococcus dongliensis]|uniref:Glycosyltransferase n=1 Tax=Enterococcus dongliensis TaxID=2559925 RepID=A0AAW8TNA5_9ENTE|nr:glycosyltransferase [Enterococcus dongliensis]MDT2638333.1 glycosyltransferase [Enterococcus dongliensis]MDT2673515.1 glycosyltransferase [Enterococcus dongliensis]
MRICIVGPSFGYGGANIIAATIGKELAKKNEIYYYSYKFKDNYSDLPESNLFFSSKKENKLLGKLGKGLEMVVKREFTPSKYKKNEINDLFNIINQKKIDIVILNSFIAVTIFAEKIKKNFPNVILIAWMHEAVEHSFGSLTKNYPTAFRKALEVVNQIVCLTKKDLEVFKKYNNNSIIIYNPLQFISPQKSNLEDPVISFTTRLDINIKGLDYLMKIAKNIPDDWTIRVAANGRQDQINKFNKLIEDNKVNEKINYVGALQGEQLIKHYLESSIFISTSRIESFQLVLIEAMECGLPIISFSHSGGREVLEYGKFGILIKNYDVSAMAIEINRLIDNKNKRIDLQKKSIERSKDFQLKKIVDEWIVLLEKWM